MLGSGGSILTVPVLVYLVGQPEKLAIAGSLAIVGLISMVASLPYIRAHQVDWRYVLLFGVPGMVGTYGGAWTSQFVSGALQLTVFALVMLAAAYLMLRPLCVNSESDRPHSFIKIGAEGVAVGWLTGFVGVGGGFLVVPALVLLGGLSMLRAVATSLVIIAMKSFAGFFKYLDVMQTEGLELDLDVILVISTIGIVGSFVGSTFAHRIPQEKLRRTFGIFLIVMGGFILYQSVPGLLS
jgi:uncharacterized membrane protein YfcA